MVKARVLTTGLRGLITRIIGVFAKLRVPPGGAKIGSPGSRLRIEAASCGSALEGVARDRTALVLCRDSSISRLGGGANISFPVIHGYNHTSSAKIEACQRSWGVVVVSKEACYNKAPQRGPHLLCSKYIGHSLTCDTY